MSKPVMNEFQPSMTEWLAAIGDLETSQAFRLEDNQRADRLETLYQEINMPYERPELFSARDLKDKTSTFAKLLEERGHLPCAIRLVPKKTDLPKLRQRGLPLKDCYENWFLKQEINVDDYDAQVYPHSDTLLWSTIFVVNDQGISGEIVRGLHSQLTHGDSESEVIRFSSDFNLWQWSKDDAEAKQYVQNMLDRLCIKDVQKRERLASLLNASFANDHLQGYFETTVWPDGKLYFIDYNRVLPRVIGNIAPVSSLEIANALAKGSIAYPGCVQGQAVLVSADAIASTVLATNDILVCDNTDVRFLPLMKKACAIVTQRGGMLSHASIVARELKKPCIVGATGVLTKIKTGDMIEVDADRGVVNRL